MAASNEYGGMNDSRTVVPLNTWILISNFKLAYNLLRRPDGTFNRHLAEFLDRKAPANPIPVDGVFSLDVVMDRVSGLWSRIYTPVKATSEEQDASVTATATQALPVIIFFHGGSFAHSSANSAIYDALCRRFSSLCGAIVVSVNYRRAPEHSYPAPYDDGWTALQWVTSSVSRPWLRHEVDTRRHLFLAGDSSGGNIVHHVARRAGENGIPLGGNILLHPMFGGERRTDSERRLDGKYFVTIQDRDWYWKAFLPEGADRDHPACNPFGPNGTPVDGVEFPKSLVVVAGFDLLQDWQINYVEGLQKAGKQVKLMFLKQATIGFYLLPNTEHFYGLMDEIKRFVTGNPQDLTGSSEEISVSDDQRR
uniref:Alpha/beta hydrolase fold-3 domain-containing protein n=1 Tax=Araucaria cunninghamii TaxID=56994 RepID=A0A0D6QS03_ARACU